MTQEVDHEERFSNGTKIGLVALINIFMPSLGNILLIGRTTGNFCCALICFFAWATHDWRIILAWSLFMDIKAYIDIFVIPAGRTKGLEHAQQSTASKVLAGNMANSEQSTINTTVHPSDLGKQMDDHSVHHIEENVLPKRHPSDLAKQMNDHAVHHEHPEGDVRRHPSDLAKQMNDHAVHHEHLEENVLPKRHPSDLAKQMNDHSVHHEHSEEEKVAPKRQAFHATGEHEGALSHGAPLPLNAEHHATNQATTGHSTADHAKPGAEHSRPTGELIHPRVGESAHTDEHAKPHGEAVPLNQLHSPDSKQEQHAPLVSVNNKTHVTGEYEKLHGAAIPLNVPLQANSKNTAEHGATTSELVHQASGEHKKLAPIEDTALAHVEKKRSLTHEHEQSQLGTHDHERQVVNQHKVVDSILHATPAQGAGTHSSSSPLANPHEHINSLLHLEAETTAQAEPHHGKLVQESGPFGGRTIEEPIHHESSAQAEDTEGGIIYSIFGEDEDGEESSGLSPLSDGLFHTVGQTDAPSAASEQHSAAITLNEQHGDASNRVHLKQVTYGAGDNPADLASVSHKKHVQLCPTCQRPQDHNRPTCPACGTHYAEE